MVTDRLRCGFPRRLGKVLSTKAPTNDVGTSFGGDNRYLAKKLNAALTESGLKVFFDENEHQNILEANLLPRLQDVYRNRGTCLLILVIRVFAHKY